MTWNNLVCEGRRGPGKPWNWACIWYGRHWATWYLYLTLSFYIEASCCFSCCFGSGAWVLVGTGSGSHERWAAPRTQHPDTPLSWEDNTRLMMGLTLLQKVVSSNSHHVGRRTGSTDAHGNLFSKGRLTPHLAEVAQGLSVSRNPRTSKRQTQPECLLPKIPQLQKLLLGC